MTLRSYRHTIYASYLGYITQAIVNNFAPLLFLTFAGEFGLTLGSITLIPTLNFAVQLAVDLLSARVVDRIGYRKCVIFAHFVCALGIAGLAFFPALLGSAYAGILLSVVLYAVGGGIIEVLISPIVESCPTEEKAGAMSLLHSFYCWGHVAVVALSTVFFRAFGVANWRTLAYVWALIPLGNMLYFGFVPIYPITAESKRLPLKRLLGSGVFWAAFFLMVCAGASEQAMSQWASAFAESGLRVSKTAGDLLGPCAFAALMGTARAVYGNNSRRLPLKKMMLGSAVLCAVCYITASLSASPVWGLLGCAVCGLSVGVFWPGTFSLATLKLPGGGTAMFALLALAGDLGCTLGPTAVGFAANALGGGLKPALLLGVIFPAGILLGVPWLTGRKG